MISGLKMPDEITLRRRIDALYLSYLEDVRHAVGDHYIWIGADTTTDEESRIVGCVTIGTLQPDDSDNQKVFLIHMEQLTHDRTADNAAMVEHGLSKLWPNGIQHHKVLLFMSDRGSPMIGAYNELKSQYPNMQQFSCLCHGFHRLSSFIQDLYPEVKSAITNVQAIFRKSSIRKSMWRSVTNLPILNFYVDWRWGTFIRAATYLNDNYSTWTRFVLRSELEHLVAAQNLRPLTRVYWIRLPEPCHDCLETNAICSHRHRVCPLEKDLRFLSSNYAFISPTITKLEGRNLKLEDALSSMERTRERLVSAAENHEKGRLILEKFDRIKQSNSSFYKLVDKIKRAPEESYFKYLTFAPVNNVCCEGVFSIYDNILTDHRRSFKIQNLFKRCFIYYNAKPLEKR